MAYAITFLNTQLPVTVLSNSRLSVPVLPKLWSVDPKGSTTGYHGIRGDISGTASFKFTYSLNAGIMFC